MIFLENQAHAATYEGSVSTPGESGGMITGRYVFDIDAAGDKAVAGS
jgi:hypothetical protein